MGDIETQFDSKITEVFSGKIGDKVGMRVMALSHTTENKVFIFGEGIYLGDLVPGASDDIPEPSGFNLLVRDYEIPNPCIKLDTGKYVWGCECWWGPVEQIKKEFFGREIVVTVIDIDAHRDEVAKKLSRT